MLRSATLCVIASAFLSISVAAGMPEDSKPGVSVEHSTGENGSQNARLITDPSGNPGFGSVFPQTLGFNMPDTNVLWVDRNHLNAISQDVFISGDGMNIFVGWWLNNERVSLYRTMANEMPIWSRNYAAEWQVAVGGSFDAGALAANGSGSDLTQWSKASHIPTWTFSWPSGYSGASTKGVDVTKDGSLVAAVAFMTGDGLLYVFDSATGDTVYTRHFNPTRGLYGVDISAEGHVIVVSTYDMIFIWEDGNSRGTLGNYGQTTAKVSGDGSVVVLGDFNGYMRAYRWNASGPYYELLIQDQTGHPWVTSVAVSEDGSTIMAGTFQYSPANSGKVLMYDTTSADPLWEHENYGDYVGSLALTPDGSRGVCGSWGQYGGTYGEVLSVFEKSSSTPFFSLLDDIDEPGSIFSVAISDSGDYVAAGGKAVHAREFGNGGQVYAIIIGERLIDNVATSSIDSPGLYLESGDSVSPQATFANYGQASATFWCHYEVYDSLGGLLYSDSQEVVDLPPASTQPVAFASSWTPTEYGPYDVVAYTLLPGDGYPGDDTLSLRAKCMHDIRAVGIKPPFPEVTVRMALTPAVTVKNEGSYIDTVTSYLSIYDSLSNQVYSDTQVVYAVKPDSSSTVQFDQWIPQEVGEYTAVAWTWVVDEYNAWNDTTSKSLQCTYEIIYDDGSAEAHYVVSSNYYDNRFAQRFTPTIDPPYYLTGARVWVNGTDQFQLSVHEDSGGLPGGILVGPDTVGATVVPGWVEHAYVAYPLDSLADFWLEIQWFPSSPAAPGIGADAASPRESRSWWFWTEPSDPGWHIWTAHDWMIRATVLPQSIGISDMEVRSARGPKSVFRLRQNSPNPFEDMTAIRFDLGPGELALDPKVTIFDASGRLLEQLDVTTDEKGGVEQVVWEGRDSEGRVLPSGIYFVRLKAGERTAVRKMVKLR